MNDSIRGATRAAARAFRSLYASGAAVAAVLLSLPAAAAVLPDAPSPAAPFPTIVASSVEREPVAPGIARVTYRLLTAAGPLVVSVVTVDPAEPTVRLGTVLAHDTIVSNDETTSSMARRTGAVAGINGDYFDINATGAPLGVLVRDGALQRSPSARVALTVTRDRAVRFETYRFAGSASTALDSVPITALNVWPPVNGASLLTPAFGAIPSSGPDVTVLDLVPFGASGARYRVAAVTNGPPWPRAPAVRLAYGAAAQGFGPVPDVGDVVTIAYDIDPPLANVAAALGGGPLLLQGGIPVDDPSSPNYAERDRRIPAAAAARFADGTLAFVVVDGRHPATSIGVSRTELTALLRALGATDAMLFDSGGSATLVARRLGDADAGVVNEPSDGVERPVADGLFAYSDAPVGPPSRLVVRPSRIVALSGARVALRARIVDAADHGLGEPQGPWRSTPSASIASIDDDGVLHAGPRPGTAQITIARGTLHGVVGVDVVERIARIVVEPVRANPNPHAALTLTAAAFDAHDRPVAVDGVVRWSAAGASIDARGRLVAGDRDAVVTASAGGSVATVTIPVGRHAEPLPLFDDAHRDGWRLVTVPAGKPGSVYVSGGELRLAYDFTSGERAAYAVADTPLGSALALACTVDGDAGGAALRATFTDRYGERATATFVRAIDFTGPRRLTLAIPASLAPPIVLHNMYVVGTLANPPVTVTGTVAVRECSALVPGAQPLRSALQAMPPANITIPAMSAHVAGADATASAG